MKHTGVKLTKEEDVELRLMLAEAFLIKPLNIELIQKRVNEIALAHGSPEIQGYYGVTQDGEFVRI